jgi:hypothetical protein
MSPKGYRTILFNLVLAAAAAANHAVSPETAAHVVDLVLLLGASAGNMALRVITTTPVGKAAIDAVQQFTTLHPDAVHQLGDAIDTAVKAQLSARGLDLPAAPPPPDCDLVAMATAIAAARDQVLATHARMTAALSAAQSQVGAALPAAPTSPAPAAG